MFFELFSLMEIGDILGSTVNGEFLVYFPGFLDYLNLKLLGFRHFCHLNMLTLENLISSIGVVGSHEKE
jgi:hypothetical protein